MNNTNKIVAVVGGTGDLGSLIVKELLKKTNVQVRLLVRPESSGKVVGWEQQGVEIVEGALGKEDGQSLVQLCQGATTVISAVQGGPEIIMEGQTQLLLAAKEAGVKRFIPSDFSLDMFTVDLGQIDTSDMRRAFADTAEKERGDMEVVHILNGGFLDRKVLFGFINIINVEEQKAYVWGDGNQAIDYTTYADTAKYTAEVAVDETTIPSVFRVAGNSLSFYEMVEAYEAETGRKLEVVKLGSLKDLDAKIEALKKGGEQNTLQYLPMMYYRAQLNGSGKMQNLQNDRYPSIKPTTFREYVNQENL